MAKHAEASILISCGPRGLRFDSWPSHKVFKHVNFIRNTGFLVLVKPISEIGLLANCVRVKAIDLKIILLPSRNR